MTAKCLSCNAGQTVSEYCAANHDSESMMDQVEGCENRGVYLSYGHYWISIYFLVYKFTIKPDVNIFIYLYKTVNGACCYAMTAACLACTEGVSEAEYCNHNLHIGGCETP